MTGERQSTESSLERVRDQHAVVVEHDARGLALARHRAVGGRGQPAAQLEEPRGERAAARRDDAERLARTDVPEQLGGAVLEDHRLGDDPPELARAPGPGGAGAGAGASSSSTTTVTLAIERRRSSSAAAARRERERLRIRMPS